MEDFGHGTKFVSGIDAYKYQASEFRAVSKSTKKHDEFIVKKGWVVFQAAGSIYGLFGRPLYVHGWLENLFLADDLFRIVPKNPVDGAFIFSFLNTKFGRLLIQRQASGHAIPRVWDPQIKKVEIPWPDKTLREKCAEPVIQAHDILEKARNCENKAIETLEHSIED